MCDPEVLPRELQNHLPLDSHLTTDAGAWMPQYAQACSGRSSSSDPSSSS